MKKIIVFTFALYSLAIFSQSVNLGDANFGGSHSVGRLLQDQWFSEAFDVKIEDVKGSPYLNKEFLPSKVEGRDDSHLMRYNMFHDNIEFFQDEKIMVLPKEEAYSEVTFLKENRKFRLIDGKYYIVLFDGKSISALKKMSVKFQKMQKSTNGYQSDIPAKFINLDDQYFIFRDNKLENTPKNAKDFVELFPEKKNDLLKFIKEKKLKLNTDSGITDAVKFTEK